MKKFSLPLISLLIVLAFNVKHAQSVPDIRGEYSGSYEIVVSNCSDSSDNGTYDAILELSIPNQSGSAFSGSATGSFDKDGFTLKEYIQLSGTISESGQISGTTSSTFLGTPGEGTFTGQLSGETLSIVNPGYDIYPDTCTYIRYMSATRAVRYPPLASFSGNPRSGKAPLSVNFTDESTGTISSWNWNFGDGVSSSIQNPSHIYAKPGTYTVSLTISGIDGSDTETKTDYIIVKFDEFRILASDGAINDYFGNSVSISSDYAIVGAPNDDDKGHQSGSAYIFEKSGNSWNQVAKLTVSDGAATDSFGRSVSISAKYIIVGAPEQGYTNQPETARAGSAYIFEKSDNSWNQVAKLTASDGAASDSFGWSVSISGGYVIIGAFGDDDNGIDSGSAYIFEKSGNSWNQVAKLTASDGAASDSFGWSVSISGGYVIVGARYDDDKKGCAYIFEKSGNSWNQVAKLTASDGAPLKWFGNSVSISGNDAIVSALYDDDKGTISGSAYIFEKSGNSWNQVTKLIASDGAAYDFFGWSVSISGGYAIVGARYDDDKGSESGSAYIFEKSGNSWNQLAKLTASDGAANNCFGSSVSIFAGYAIVGADEDDDYGWTSGSAYIFDLSIPDDFSGDAAMPWIPLLLFDD